MHRTLQKKSRQLRFEEIHFLNIGTWILGTGGGGSPYHPYLNSRILATQGKHASFVDPLSLSDDACVAVVAFIGAPLVSQERLDDYAFAIRPLKVLEEHLGTSFDAVISIEIGGANGMHPIPISMELGLPVIDADCMGRAYPELQMISTAVSGMELPPMVISDIRNNDVLLAKAQSWAWAERILRVGCAEMGAIATFCMKMTGKQVKKHTLHNTVSKAIKIGSAVTHANTTNTDPVQAVLDTAYGKQLFAGKVHDIARRIEGGYLKGQVIIKGTGPYQDNTLKIHFQNEFSVALLNNKVCVTTPDLICVLDTTTGEGIGTDTMRYGQRVSVLALPTDPIYLTPAGLDAVAPRAFGFDINYKSVF